MERSARLGALLPYRKAAEAMAEFLPIKPTESFATLRHRMLKLGERLDEKARQRARFEPPAMGERHQKELDLPNDPEREFVVSIDTAHVRASQAWAGKSFEIAVARLGAADAALAPAVISRLRTPQRASFNPGRCRPCKARATRAAAK